MSPDAVAVIGFVALFALMLLRVPVGIAMGVVGVLGFGYLIGDIGPALKLLAQSPIRTATDAEFAVIPLFLLMGAFASASGMSRELFRASNTFLGHFKGGLGIATIAACGGFAAICGSSVATAATFSKVAYPEMRQYGYPQSFATGVIAAGGSLGIMIPPSTVFAVYGLITEQDIGKLFIAGVIPGILAVGMYIATINIIALVRPGFLPAGPRHSWGERLEAVRDIWAVVLLFVFIIGGLYGGLFTATEAAGMGAAGAFIISVLRQKLSRADFWRCLIESLRTTAAVFTILIGALIFGYFLTITQTPQKLTEFLTGLGLGPLRRAGADHADVSGARLHHGRHGHDHPDDSDRVPGDQGARLRSDLVRRHHRDDGGTRPDPSAGRHERVRDQERDQGRQAVHDILWRNAVRAHRYIAAGHPDCLPDHCALAALAYVGGFW